MNNHIIVGEKFYECKTYSETLKRFLERWAIKSREIKKSSFDSNQCNIIANDYISEAFLYFSSSTSEFKDT